MESETAPLDLPDNLENLPPPPAVVIATTTSSDDHHHHHHQNSSEDGGEVLTTLHLVDPTASQSSLQHHPSSVQHNTDEHSLSTSSVLTPGPQREEPTLKEKLVHRERQRRKEAERARWKRQFALMNNEGGMVYDDNNNNTNNTGAGAVASSTICAIGSMSITCTVGEEEEEEEETNAHGNEKDAPNRTGGGSSSPVPLGYTMERFLQEGGRMEETTPVAVVASSTGPEVAKRQTQQSVDEPNNSTQTATDKGVVMERFLNEPVVVDVPPDTVDLDEISPSGQSDRDPDHLPSSESHHHGDNSVNRSVSFDMQLRQQPIPGRGLLTGQDRTGTATDTSVSVASVQVEAPDDLANIQHELDNIPASASPPTSVQSVVAPSSLAMDDDSRLRHNSMDQESTLSSPNRRHDGPDDDIDEDEEPRVLVSY